MEIRGRRDFFSLRLEERCGGSGPIETFVDGAGLKVRGINAFLISLTTIKEHLAPC